jgi:alkanesulfonate monooxygenase SsuD/methylene tetrahydromethanopterin reductase-like flavin-dependent oxidoreductase (luciferase family)
MSYVVQADRYAQSLDKIRAAAATAGRSMDTFTAAHLVFITIGRDFEAAKRAWVSVLSNATRRTSSRSLKRYGVIGTPEQCAEQLERFRAAGCSYFVMSAIGEPRTSAPSSRRSPPRSSSIQVALSVRRTAPWRI